MKYINKIILLSPPNPFQLWKIILENFGGVGGGNQEKIKVQLTKKKAVPGAPPPTSTKTGDQRQQTGAQATAAVVLVSEAVLTPTAVGRPTTTAVTTATTLKVNTTTAMAVDTTTIEAQLTETTTSTSAATATTATMEPTTAPETTVPATAPAVPAAARL